MSSPRAICFSYLSRPLPLPPPSLSLSASLALPFPSISRSLLLSFPPSLHSLLLFSISFIYSFIHSLSLIHSFIHYFIHSFPFFPICLVFPSLLVSLFLSPFFFLNCSVFPPFLFRLFHFSISICIMQYACIFSKCPSKRTLYSIRVYSNRLAQSSYLMNLYGG